MDKNSHINTPINLILNIIANLRMCGARLYTIFD